MVRSMTFAMAATAVVGAFSLCYYRHFRRRRRRRRSERSSNPLATFVPPLGRAVLLTLDKVDRIDSPGGKDSRARPGRPASHYLDVSRGSSPPTTVAFEELFATDSPFVLYAIEDVDTDAPFLVFLTLTANARRRLWLEEAFIDRGIRKLVEVGSTVAVASVETAETYARKTISCLEEGTLRLSFVWNTGRCGSTLMHKAMSAMGTTASFSEPQWLDQLHFNRTSATVLTRCVRVCVALETITARCQAEAVPEWRTATNFAFNPKSGGMPVAEATVSAFPHARHAFMYRSCHKVVTSFTGLKFSHGVPTFMTLAWALLGVRALPRSISSLARELPLSELSSLPVVMMTCMWLRTVHAWMSTVDRREKENGKDDPLVSAVVIRMDEFVSKDTREKVVRTALRHLRVLDRRSEDVTPALEVFSVNSQKGSKMSGSKAKLVTKDDVSVIRRCVVVSLAQQAEHGMVSIQDEGANVLLKGSVGYSTRL